jgi:hypothetical protein
MGNPGRLEQIARTLVFGALMVIPAGCSEKSDTQNSAPTKRSASRESPEPGPTRKALTSADQDALSFANSWRNEKFTRHDDGLFTVAKVSIGGGQHAQYLVQLRKLEVVGATPEVLSEADQLNGVRWRGWIQFAPTSTRVANRDGWGDWRSDTPRIQVTLKSDQWSITGGIADALYWGPIEPPTRSMVDEALREK